jgi:hypothetical protein
MTFRTILATGGLTAAALLVLMTAGEAAAEQWEATSTTAISITGNVTFAPNRITFQNGASLPLAPVGHTDSFEAQGARVPADLYKVTAPADPLLLNGNRLCDGPVTWIITWSLSASPGRQGRGIAMFSSRKPPPPGGPRAGECGTYFYETGTTKTAAAPAASDAARLECPAALEGHKVLNWGLFDGVRPLPRKLAGDGTASVIWTVTPAEAAGGVRIVCGYLDTSKVSEIPLPPSIRGCLNREESHAFECN